MHHNKSRYSVNLDSLLLTVSYIKSSLRLITNQCWIERRLLENNWPLTADFPLDITNIPKNIEITDTLLNVSFMDILVGLEYIRNYPHTDGDIYYKKFIRAICLSMAQLVGHYHVFLDTQIEHIISYEDLSWFGFCDWDQFIISTANLIDFNASISA